MTARLYIYTVHDVRLNWLEFLPQLNVVNNVPGWWWWWWGWQDMSDNIPGKVSVMTTAVIWAQDEHLTDMWQYLVNPSVTTFQGEIFGMHTTTCTLEFFWDKIGIHRCTDSAGWVGDNYLIVHTTSPLFQCILAHLERVKFQPTTCRNIMQLG